jgi:hypothetical protein
MWHPKVLYIHDEGEIRSNLSLPARAGVDEAIRNSGAHRRPLQRRASRDQASPGAVHPGQVPVAQDKQSTPEERRRGVHRPREEGIVNRYGEDNEEAWERAAKEIEVFLDSGLEHYFLQAWDFCQFCNAKDIIRGPGRGSAAGAIVSYALGITDVDPLHYDLVFERFWNPGRAKGFPDIDNDFPKGNRKRSASTSWTAGAPTRCAPSAPPCA